MSPLAKLRWRTIALAVIGMVLGFLLALWLDWKLNADNVLTGFLVGLCIQIPIAFLSLNYYYVRKWRIEDEHRQ